jgi:flagellar assembly protein FliH
MHAEASAEGYAAGHAEGLAAARHSAARMDALLTSLQQAVREADQFVADRLLATAVEIANQVLRQSLRLNPELLLPVVREAVSTLNAHLGHPALFVHPDDAALIRAELGDQLANNNWRLIEDATLTAGGCRVELGASEVDATLETRWRRVIEAMGISQDWLADRNG